MSASDAATTTAGRPNPHEIVRRVLERRRVPVSTYRLQFHRDFGFAAAHAIVRYLGRLGVTDVYSSPYLRARPGSVHGYDICSHGDLNPEMGSREDFDAFTRALAAEGMGQILDFVPNHMGVDPDANPWWRDVLENGLGSHYARFFDIDWDPIKPELREKVLLPLLPDQYGVVLERGDLHLVFDGEGAGFCVRCGDQSFPVDPKTAARIVRCSLERLESERAPSTEEGEDAQELARVAAALDRLPGASETDPERAAERRRAAREALSRLGRLVASSPRARRRLDATIGEFNGRPENPASFDSLHRLLEDQHYRLAYWRTASHEINYRRFFDVNDLASIRMEDPEVFEATHSLVLRLVCEGRITGLRLDHVDGLIDPVEYVRRLQEAAVLEWTADLCAGQSPPIEEVRRAIRELGAAHGRRGQPLHVVIEKVLSAGEDLSESWAVAGTTGYEFANTVNGLFVDPRSVRPMQRTYERFTGRRTSFADVLYESKRHVLTTSMASELNLLAHELNRISERDRRSRDFTLDSLRDALREVVACFPVYRTYVDASAFTDADRRTIETAVIRARYRNPTMEPSIFDFVRDALLPQRGATCGDAEYRRRVRFSMKFQQYTGPVHAKGLEDTCFYRYNLLLSLNEVGGDPRRFGRTPAEFHEENLRRLERWPHGLIATSTHDTKRGEDARARLDVLSEMPEEWRRSVFRWARHNARHRTKLEEGWAPDRNDEYHFYQALIAAWQAEPVPADPAIADTATRLASYMRKAIREAKVHTSWVNPNAEYEEGVSRFVARTLMGRGAGRFLSDFIPLQRRVAAIGCINSLSQLVLKIASPGVPDFYQGSELWVQSLVDPDNRRLVDYSVRERMLAEMAPLLDEEERRAGSGERVRAVREMLERWEDGRIKLFVTASGLRLRRRLAPVFLDGEYVPLVARGDLADHVVAFARRDEQDLVIAIAPRLVLHLLGPGRPLPVGPETWRETRVVLPEPAVRRGLRNAITGETLDALAGDGLTVADALATCPVALLYAAGGTSRTGPEQASPAD